MDTEQVTDGVKSAVRVGARVDKARRDLDGRRRGRFGGFWACGKILDSIEVVAEAAERLERERELLRMVCGLRFVAGLSQNAIVAELRISWPEAVTRKQVEGILSEA